MAPTPTGVAFCMASPRTRSSRAASAIEKVPAAASAEYSPSECPATKAASRARSSPASASRTRIVARLTAMRAGWAFAVSVSASAGPSNISARELLRQRRVDLVEDRAGLRKGLGKRLAHADRLAALPRKHECPRHVMPPRRSGARRKAGQASQGAAVERSTARGRISTGAFQHASTMTARPSIAGRDGSKGLFRRRFAYTWRAFRHRRNTLERSRAWLA